jgi:23S rRNA (cytosine1962-C5)-methyltransferase
VRIVLKRGKERAVKRHHPWVFSGAIARVEGDPRSGDTVDVVDAEGGLLGRGAFSPSSQIRVRMWTFDDAAVDDALISSRIEAAVKLRRDFVLNDDTDCARLVFAEGDGLPGLVADLYRDVVVIQCQSAGAERFRDLAVSSLLSASGAKRAYERSDAEVRHLEGLEPRAGSLVGGEVGELVVRENGIKFHVDVARGHKTGFYLDQRDSRAWVRRVARGRRVLNCFSYTGGFSIASLLGGAASAMSVDSSLPALEIAEKNAALNDVGAKHEGLKGDVFDVLRGLHGDGERFDLVVLDPPKLAPKAAHLDKAVRAYRDLAHRGLLLLSEGGLLVTFSCSGAVDRETFRTLTAQAALEADRNIRLLAQLGHPPDHPLALSFPEGEYLKGLVCAV